MLNLQFNRQMGRGFAHAPLRLYCDTVYTRANTYEGGPISI